MSHFRLCYRDPNQRFKVVIIEAASLIHARLKVTLAAHDGDMIFAEGHELRRRPEIDESGRIVMSGGDSQRAERCILWVHDR